MVNQPVELNQVNEIFTNYLEKNDFRKTEERYAILKEVYSRSDHFDVNALYVSMIEKNYHVSRATVYNTLNLLIASDLVTRHQFSENISKYEKSFGFKQHDHMVCTKCNKIKEFCNPNIHQIKTTMDKLLGFETHSHSLILYGICKDCQQVKN